MGAQMVYLREPVTGKEVEDGGDLDTTGLLYGIAAMQGWRRNMEDAHLAVTQLDEKISLFGVFDGHGGRGVSKFAAKQLPNVLKQSEAFKRGDYAKALEASFLAIDEQLKEAEGRKAIETLDRPHPGDPIHPMVVPRRVLQRFLGRGAPCRRREEGADAGGGERPAEGEGCADEEASAGQEAGRPEPEVAAADQDGQEPAQADAAAGQDDEDPPTEPEEPATDQDKENVPLAGDDNADEAETEEEEPAGEQASGDGEDNEEDDEMALVDPSRLTRDPTPEAQGCTAVVVLVVRREDGAGPQIYCANAGDSRAILSRAGQVVALSEDHKPENPEETARITKAGGVVQHMPGGARVQGDLNLSRALGDLRYKKPENLPPEEQIVTAFPEVRTFELTGEDEFLVLGCDGIWERTGNQEMVDFVRPRLAALNGGSDGPSLTKICGDICDKGLCPSMDTMENQAFDGTGCDNMTVMIVQARKEMVEKKRRGTEEEGEEQGQESKKPKLEEQQEPA